MYFHFPKGLSVSKLESQSHVESVRARGRNCQGLNTGSSSRGIGSGFRRKPQVIHTIFQIRQVAAKDGKCGGPEGGFIDKCGLKPVLQHNLPQRDITSIFDKLLPNAIPSSICPITGTWYGLGIFFISNHISFSIFHFDNPIQYTHVRHGISYFGSFRYDIRLIIARLWPTALYCPSSRTFSLHVVFGRRDNITALDKINEDVKGESLV